MAELTIHRFNEFEISWEMPDNSFFVQLKQPGQEFELALFFSNKDQWLAFRRAFARSKDYHMSVAAGSDITSLEDAEAYAESLNVD